MGEGVSSLLVSGTIAEAGEFEPWLLEVAEDTTVDIYMWSETGSLDTHLWLYQGVATFETLATGASGITDNDDNDGAVQTAVALGILSGPVGSRYNSAIMGVELRSGTYTIAPRSYDDSETGDYNLLVAASSQ